MNNTEKNNNLKPNYKKSFEQLDYETKKKTKQTNDYTNGCIIYSDVANVLFQQEKTLFQYVDELAVEMMNNAIHNPYKIIEIKPKEFEEVSSNNFCETFVSLVQTKIKEMNSFKSKLYLELQNLYNGIHYNGVIIKDYGRDIEDEEKLDSCIHEVYNQLFEIMERLSLANVIENILKDVNIDESKRCRINIISTDMFSNYELGSTSIMCPRNTKYAFFQWKWPTSLIHKEEKKDMNDYEYNKYWIEVPENIKIYICQEDGYSEYVIGSKLQKAYETANR